MYPNVSDEVRRDTYRKYYRMAYPKKKKNKSTKEMAKELKAIFGG